LLSIYDTASLFKRYCDACIQENPSIMDTPGIKDLSIITKYPYFWFWGQWLTMPLSESWPIVIKEVMDAMDADTETVLIRDLSIISSS
jgi:hypothetical protein